MTLTKKEKIQGALVGLLIGDALGVPYEFNPAHNIPPLTDIEYEPPIGFNRSHKGIPIGTWSDDGAQALCLLASLLHCHKFDAEDFANRLKNWYQIGYMAVDGRVFDIGITTGIAINNLNNGEQPLLAGLTDEHSNGNGSLMRIMPLALWHQGSDAELVADAQSQSRITHGHLRSQVCCALYCLWARYLFLDSKLKDGASSITKAWTNAVVTLQELFKHDDARLEQLEWHIQPFDEAYQIKGSGYVVDSLHSAKHCMQQNSFELCVKSAIALGNDTDTTACITGGIAGLVFGINHIPQRWRDDLRSKELYQQLLNQLLDMMLE